MARHYSRRTDHNEKEIVAALRQAGRDVICVNGIFDLLVGYRGVTFILEVKNPKTKHGLTDKQEYWLRVWQGNPIFVVETPEQAIAVTDPDNLQETPPKPHQIP